jgi:hypothetical protein
MIIFWIRPSTGLAIGATSVAIAILVIVTLF